jgi:hypothetical protein
MKKEKEKEEELCPKCKSDYLKPTAEDPRKMIDIAKPVRRMGVNSSV